MKRHDPYRKGAEFLERLLRWSLSVALVHAFTLTWIEYEPNAVLDVLGLIPEAWMVPGYGLSAFAMDLDQSAGLEIARTLAGVEAPVGIIHLCWLSPLVGVGSALGRSAAAQIAALGLNAALGLSLVARFVMPVEIAGAEVAFGSGMLLAGLEHGVLSWFIWARLSSGGRRRPARV